MANICEKYNTVTDTVSAETVVKKSRFIATAIHIESEEDALVHIERLKKQYWDARHNCYAYILGRGGDTLRFSDDGEPSGTAGKPILEVLKNKELTYTLIVVTRYFGGVLLGTGGLVRAYTDASVLAVKEAEDSGKLACMTLMKKLSVETGYEMSGKVQYLLAESDVLTLSSDYGEKVVYNVAVRSAEVSGFTDKITDVTNGKIVIKEGEEDYYPLTK